MTQQILRGKGVSPLKGLFIIIGLIASIVAVSWLERVIDAATNLQYARFLVWGVIIAEALALMRLVSGSYRYTVSEGRFIVERLYGDSARIVHDIQGDTIEGLGPKDDIFKRFGNAQSYESATARGVTLPQVAIAYKKARQDAGCRLLVIQPDDDMLKALKGLVSVSSGEE